MKTKRILSVALTLVMLIGLFPGMGLTASAAGSTTGITPSNTSGTLTITLKIKADQAAPAAPTAASVTINSITLNTITNGEYKMGDGEWQDSPAFTGLTMNTEYTFYQRLKGDEDHNASPASSAVNITTANHVHSWTYTANGATITATCSNTDGGHSGSTTATLTLAAPEHSVFGDAKSAEAAVTGGIDGVAAPAIVYKKGDTTLTAAPTDAGTYTANITLGGVTASVAFTIVKANITPSVSISGWTYGETANAPSVTGNTDNGTVTFTYAIKGSTDFSATVPTNAGEYTVKATVAATNNYNGGEATADFTIAKATVTVTAEAKSKTYGEADPALTYTSSGLVGSDTLTGALTREAGENAGTYAIGQGTLTAGDNYTISYTGANFTINKAAITITADDKSSKYGDDLAELTYQVGGAYKAGDELGVTVSTTATKTSDVGEYPITVSWNENANYTATVTNGKYTITKTGLTVTATGYTGAYDGAAHSITVDVGSSGATVYYAAEALTAENYATAGSTTNPTYTDAGEYTVYFYVVSGNYDPDTVSGSKAVSISKATGTATDAQKPAAKPDLVADNTDQALVTAPASLPEGYTAIQYSLDGETWADTIPTGKDAGNYTVSVKYVGDDNHANFEGDAITVKIKAVYTVKFNMNGADEIDDQSVVDGEKATKPADPTRDGYKFDGWYQDATFAKTFDFETPITANVTVYAKWMAIGYAMTSITGTTADASHTWTKGSTTEAVITVKPDEGEDHSFAHFTGVQIDGKTLTRDTDYTAREGSTIVTLKPAMLQKLSVGVHTVTINFDNGSVETKLTIKAAPGSSTSPKTGDTSLTGLWAALMAVSGIGFGGMLLVDHKRRKARTR